MWEIRLVIDIIMLIAYLWLCIDNNKLEKELLKEQTKNRILTDKLNILEKEKNNG